MIDYIVLKNGKDTGQIIRAEKWAEAYMKLRESINAKRLFDTLEYRLVKT
jgi:hypothetical protein